MMFKPLNRRRKRRLEGKELPTNKSFCYIVYSKRTQVPEYTTGPDGLRWLIDYRNELRECKRPFSSYAEAIAHLTRIKLAIDEEDSEWINATPCKIVEGCYTKSGKEHITKEVKLNNECDSTPERHFGSGLSRKLKHAARQLSLRFGIPISEALEIVRNNPGWSSGSATSSSTTTAVDIGGVQPRQVSDQYRWYSATTN